jgi:hypothetical protein
MLTVGGTVVAPESTWRRRITTEAWRPEAIPGMAARAEAIRAEGAVAACQLVHLGRETTGAEQWFHSGRSIGGRSPREPTRPRPLSGGEVDAVVEGFRVSAVNAAEAGFQVIELHAAHGYLWRSSCRRRRTQGGRRGTRRDRRAHRSRDPVVAARRGRGDPAVDRGRGGLAPSCSPTSTRWPTT